MGAVHRDDGKRNPMPTTTIPRFNLRPVTAADADTIMALNNAEVPHVSFMSRTLFDSLLAESLFFMIAEDVAGTCAAYILALDEQAYYKSLNFIWFKERYQYFIYVDRIVVAEAFKGKGLGRTLYEALESATDTTHDIIACEVNTNPPNPQSHDFHHRLGFVEVGTQDTDDGKKTVSMKVKKMSRLATP